MAPARFSHDSLTLEVDDGPEAIVVRWLGTSMSREPGKFVLPVLTKVLQQSTEERRPVVIDFQHIDYLNSSTVTPLIRILEQARRGSNHVTVLYSRALRWQALSFTALEVFGTGDGRIQIRGI